MATNTQIQVRIDKKTKNQAKKIFESIGLDISSAIRMFLRQAINSGTIPYEIRDENGFTFKQIKELKKDLKDAKENPKSFSSAKELINDIFS
jgi:DNA-damage-inducible protein J